MVASVNENQCVLEKHLKAPFQSCIACGSPISPIQEIMGNTLMALFKDSYNIDIGGSFTIISCFKCLSNTIYHDLNRYEVMEMQRIIDLFDRC